MYVVLTWSELDHPTCEPELLAFPPSPACLPSLISYRADGILSIPSRSQCFWVGTPDSAGGIAMSSQQREDTVVAKGVRHVEHSGNGFKLYFRNLRAGERFSMQQYGGCGSDGGLWHGSRSRCVSLGITLTIIVPVELRVNFNPYYKPFLR